MMALTHGLMGLAAVTVVYPGLSEYVSPPILVAAFVGGCLPDLDLVASHRKTLHFPVVLPVLAAFTFLAFVLTGSPAVLVLGVVLGTAGLHSLSDVLGGSAEQAPWDPDTEFGVYNHVLGRWHRPQRLVRYSGAPEDFALAAVLGVIAIASPVTTSGADGLVVVVLCVTGLYSLTRRRFGELAAGLQTVVPTRVKRLLPTLQVVEREGEGTTVRFRLGR